MAVINELSAVVKLFINCLGKHNSGSGRRILLLVVMFFNYLNIELTAEDLGRFLSKFGKKIDPERHIKREEYRDLRCRGGYLRTFLVGISGSCDNNRNIVHLAVRKQVGQYRRVREVNDNIRLFGHIEQRLVNRETSVLFAELVYSGDDLTVRALGAQSCNNFSHTSASACYSNFFHFSCPFDFY